MSKFNKLTSLVVAMSMAMVVMPAFAQDEAEEDTSNNDEGTLELVVVTGTRSKPRSIADSPVPVDVVTNVELMANGTSDMANLLRTVVPSFNVNDQAISDGATVVRPANLRGLSPDSTLILVNGKRRHKGSVIAFSGGGIADGAQAPDISTIPAIAIKRIEVLRDGASAQYGSDAIAGVINFILNDDDEGGRFELKYGEFSEGDGAQTTASGNIGMALGTGGFVNLSLELTESDPTSRSVQRSDAQALIDAGNTHVRTPAAQVWGNPEISNDMKLFLNSAIDLGNGGEAYMFGNWSEKTVEGGFFFRNPNTRGGIFRGPVLADGTPTLLTADLADGAVDNSACPIVPIVNDVPDPTALASLEAAGCYAHNLRFPGGFTPFFGGDVVDLSLYMGTRGEFSDGTSYDFSAGFGLHSTEFHMSNTVNSSLGPDTPTVFTPGAYEQFERGVNADFSKDLGYMILSYGAEFRKESFTITAGDEASWKVGSLVGQGFSIGSNGFPGFKPADAGTSSRHSGAAYVDLEANLTDRFLGQLAMRFEDFSDFGSTFDWKVAGLFDVTEAIKIRGSVSTGFRAPTIGQSNVRSVQTQFLGDELVDIATLPPTNPVSVKFGGIALTPEESQSYAIGFIYEGYSGLFLTADFFHIEVSDRITQTSAITLSDEDRQDLIDQGVTDAIGLNSVKFFTNDFDTTTTGVDLVASYSQDLFGGNMNYTVAYNYTDTTVDKFGPNVNAVKILRLEEALPRHKGSLSAVYSADSWSLMGRGTYYGTWIQSLNSGNLNNLIFAPSAVILDAEFAYNINDSFGFALGLNNITDDNGPIDPTHSSGRKYSSTSPYGANGRFWYAKLMYNY